jgi:UDP-N-acetyl-D-mannosaminuronic acid dehydrogenase
MKISVVGGGGRVGLPLSLVLASAGHKVVIVDSNESRVNQINNRIIPFSEEHSDEIIQSLSIDQLVASTENLSIEKSDVCILIIGTPVLDDGTPSVGALFELVETIIPYLNETKLLLLRSTVYPNVTQKLKSLLSEAKLEIEVAYCPERIAEGKAIFELKSLPQIIGADSDLAFIKAKEVFESITPKIIRTTIKEAELCKLFANSYRYINFAIANEFFEICQENDINWDNVWFALKEDYPRAQGLPTPGFAAGPCLVKDTQQLDYYFNNKFELGRSAIKINEHLPDYVISVLRSMFDLKHKKVGILGMTFKGDVDDFRSSLSFRLKNLLEREALEVYCSDAILQKNYFVSLEFLMENSDIIILSTPHRSYKNIVTKKPIIDLWRVSKNNSLI